MSKILLFVARALFGAIFFSSGVGHLVAAKQMSGYAGSKGVPMPEVAVPFSGGMMLTGALGILTGWFPRFGAATLITFLAVTNYFMHPFWKVEDPQQKQMEMSNFNKNVSLMGGALLIAALDENVVRGDNKKAALALATSK